MKKNLLYIISLFLLPLGMLAQIPAGYYNNAQGKTGATLKTALYNIIHTHTERTYTELWTDFQSTDKRPNGKVWDIYSDIPGGTPAYEYTFVTNQCGNYSGEGSCYNREHSFPKSWFNDATPMYTDLFHIYPTDGYVNGKRSNYPYGEVSSPSWTSTNGSKLGTNITAGYSGTVFEPIDAYKGDLARTYLYMVTCYENVVTQWHSDVLSGDTYPALSKWTLDLLLKWAKEDPVSQKEIDRNNAIYNIQHNRNPYIDHPEYIDEIWGTANAVTNISELSVSVYPNPTTRIIHVKKGVNHSMSYILYNHLGQMMSKGNLVSGTNEIDLSTFQKGLFMLIINVPDKKWTKQYKILKI
ncbi:MAG: endonuclease [Bacteroidales bacterium]|nr:endonuclease [Bacteroidales bacterium]